MKRKKLATYVLVILLPIIIVSGIDLKPIQAQALQQPYIDRLPVMDNGYDNGSGDSAEDPCLISTKEDLFQLADNINNRTFPAGKYYKVQENIDLAGEIWTPIGIKETAPFKGYFDFNDKVISNYKLSPDIKIDRTNDDLTDVTAEYGGLFGLITKEAMITGYVIPSEDVTIDTTTGDNVALHDNSADDALLNTKEEHDPIDELTADLDNLFLGAQMGLLSESAPVAGSGGALDFSVNNTSNPKIQIPNNTGTRFSGSSNFTISMWVFPKSAKPALIYRQNAYAT